MPKKHLSSTENRSAWVVFSVFLKLGLTSFGGPIAHLGYFHDEFVIRRKWISEQNYADLVALCQFLPGPASSQVGIALGLLRAGYKGAFAAWVGFTLPSALVLILFAFGFLHTGDIIPSGILHGLKIAAVAVVAQAIWGMAKNLCTDTARISIMAMATCLVLFIPSVFGQISAILCATFIGRFLCRSTSQLTEITPQTTLKPRSALFCLTLFVLLLIALPFAAIYSQSLALFDTFFRIGSLVFGGGHVVLPLLQTEVVTTNWVNQETFLAGYSLAQAIPGPLFTFSAFLGTTMNMAPNGWLGAIICLCAIFLPSFLLVIGTLPFWQNLRRNTDMQAALAGVNAAVVGLLLAAFYQPVWLSAVFNAKDFSLALITFIALMFWKCPPWLAVISCGGMGWLIS